MSKENNYKPKTWYGKYTYGKSYKYYFAIIGLCLIILFIWNSYILEANLYTLIGTIILGMIVYVHIILLLLKAIGEGGPTSKRAGTTGYRTEYTDIIGFILFIFPTFLGINLITLINVSFDIKDNFKETIIIKDNYDINCDFSFWSLANGTFIYYIQDKNFCLIQKRGEKNFFLENYKYIGNLDDLKNGNTYQYYKHSKLLIPNK